MKHDLSPEIASKSLSALKVKITPFFGKTISWNRLQDRKEEILSELGDIVGSSAANAIGDMASQQVLLSGKKKLDSEIKEIFSRRRLGKSME